MRWLQDSLADLQAQCDISQPCAHAGNGGSIDTGRDRQGQHMKYFGYSSTCFSRA